MQERDDLATYIAKLSDEDRAGIERAGEAIDLAILLYRAREQRGLTQVAAASRAGLAQQAVSRLERPPTNPRFGTLRRYLGALGYEVELVVKEPETGEIAASLRFPPLGDDGDSTDDVRTEDRRLVGAGAAMSRRD